MIKVIGFSKYVGWSGTCRTNQLFLKYLAQDPNYEVYLLYQEGGDKSRLPHVTEWLGEDHVIPYRHIHKKGAESPYHPEDTDFTEVVKRIDPDIMHIHHSGYDEFPAFRELYPSKTKIVTTNIFGYAGNKGHVDCHIYICPWIRERALANGGSDGPVLYNPIEKPYIDPRYQGHVERGAYEVVRHPAYKRYCKGELGLDPEQIVLGRLGRDDNFDPISLKAFKRIEKEFGDQVLYYVVSPCQGWKKTAKKLKIRNVIWIDPTTNDETIALMYGSFDIYCHARCDGDVHSTAIEQALMYGVPSISHDGHSYSGQVDQLANVGFCVPYQDDAAYYRHLRELIASPGLRGQLGIKSQRQSINNCEASAVVERLKGIYNWVLDKGDVQ